jgi:hypothetical protein
MKNKFSIAMSLAVILTMLLTSLVLADTISSDVDFVATGNQTLINLGTVTPNQAVNTSTSFQLVCSGKNHADQGNTVSVQYFSAVVPAGSLTAGNVTIGPIPASWADDSGDCTSPAPVWDDNGNSAVNITAPAAPGTYDYVVTYKVCQSNDPSQCGGIDPNDVSGSVPPVTFRLTVVGDTTPPSITKVITGTAGANSWYTSNVTVAWTVTDPDSSVVIDSGCGTQNFTSETTGTTSSCTAHSAGGSTSDSVTIKIDTTGPTAALAVTAGTLGSNGWYTSDVTVSTSGSDSISSPVVCTANQFQTTDTAGATFNGSCTNAAGLSTNAAPLTVKLDKTGPSAILAVTAGTAGTNGWYTSDLTISTSGSDSISGPVSCSADQYRTTETAGAIFNGSCTNAAGLTTNAAPLSVKLDKTGPSATLAAAGTLGNNGWYISDVAITTSGSDSISDPTTCTADQSQTTDTASANFNGSCTNDAGLSTAAAPLMIKRDATAPSISAQRDTAANANGWNNTDVASSYTASDALSGLVSPTSGSFTFTSEGAAQSHTFTVSDMAGNSNSATVSGVNIDKTNPTLTFGAPGPAANAAGWNNTDVSFSFTTSDNLSGVDTTNPASSPLVLTDEGSSVTGDVTVTDKAGNSATFTSPAVKIDKTAPSINGSRSPLANANGWNNSDVASSYTASDVLSGLDSPATGSFDFTSEGAGQSHTFTVFDKAGNSASATVSGVNIDKTAPTISGAPDRAANSANWYNADVIVSFTCADALSGVDTCSDPSTLGEGAAQSVTGTAFDLAGNSASDTVSDINIDKTKPSIVAAATTSANGNSWYNSDVTVHFTCADVLSGIPSGACPADQVLNTEGAAVASTAQTVTDAAGNTSDSSNVVTVKIDKTAPTASASASPAANSNGWNNSNVTVSFSGSDALSGLASCDANVVLSAEAAGQSASGTCTDKAGNVSTPATKSGINIDKTVPSVSLVGGPASGGSYYFSSVPAAPTCSASDILSGLDGSCSVSGYSGAVGPHTITTSAMDKAGNSASASASYTVLAWTLNGFYQPVDMGKVNIAKNGSTVPLKFEAFAGPTELTNTSIVSTFIQQESCVSLTTDDIETYATGNTSLRYDTTGGQFIFNWQTPKVVGGCYKVTLTLQDGRQIFADFKLK